MKEDLSKNYFKTRQSSAPGIGTGLEIEIPYRHYWELNTLMHFLPAKRPLAFLEYGCGAGRWALSLAPIASSYIGVDLSAVLLECARQDAIKSGYKHLTFIQSNIQDFIPEQNQLFDVMYTAGVLQYLNDYEIRTLLIKAREWLAEGGVFIDRSTVVMERERLNRQGNDYFSIYRTADEITSLFRTAGFKYVKQKRSYCYLQYPSVLRSRLIQRMIKVGIDYFPKITFHIMRYFSVFMEKIQGESGREADGIKYSHNFFIFTKELNTPISRT